jgi:tetratricopeptide (TPR) repeat protein
MARADREQKNLDFQIAFFEGILQQEPNLVDVLIPLGDAYTKRGLYEKGLEVDLRLSRLRPGDPSVLYNLACSYSLLKQIEPGLEALEKALSLGYDEFSFLMSDPDLESLRKEPQFKKLVERYRKKRQKRSS